MNCPECNNKTAVVDSRRVELNVYRKRVCSSCGHKFYTEETEVEDTSGLKYYWSTSKREYRGKK